MNINKLSKKLRELLESKDNEIISLTNRVIDLETVLEDSNKNSDTFFVPRGSLKSKPLPVGCEVDFQIKGNKITCGIVNGRLRINGNTRISILPEATNHFYIINREE
jgi:hypothetical protein